LKFKVKKGGGVGFARKEAYEYDGTKYEADLKDGDIVKILDSGTEEDGQWGKQNNFKIKTRNGEKKLALNQNTINVLVIEFGEESESWIGQEVTVILKKDIIAGKKVIIPYLVTPAWSLDEYGELVKKDDGSGVPLDYPEENINIDDIPFD